MDRLTNPWQPVLAYLVRHGETEENAENCFRGWNDPPLNDNGMEAAVLVANFFAYERIGRVVCSDLSRAMQTAQAIMDTGTVACPYLSTDFNLRPWNIGGFAGKEKNAENLKKLSRYIKSPETVIPDGESLATFRQRIEEATNGYIANQYDGLPTVIVGHTSGLTALHRAFYGDDDNMPDDLIEPGGVIGIYMDGNGKISMVPRMGEIQAEAEPQAS